MGAPLPLWSPSPVRSQVPLKSANDHGPAGVLLLNSVKWSRLAVSSFSNQNKDGYKYLWFDCMTCIQKNLFSSSMQSKQLPKLTAPLKRSPSYLCGEISLAQDKFFYPNFEPDTHCKCKKFKNSPQWNWIFSVIQTTGRFTPQQVAEW